jgi:L-arabinokinase
VGVSSSAAIEVATMMNLIEHFDLRERLDEMTLAAMCQQVENRVVGAPCGIMDQVTCCSGEAGTLLRMVCQPHELQQPLLLPENVRVVGINSNVKHSVGGGLYGRTRCAAFMAHKMVLEQMRRAGKSLGRELVADPMNGYLANLDPDDYKRHFRSRLPEFINGEDFIRDYKSTIDTATNGAGRRDLSRPARRRPSHPRSPSRPALRRISRGSRGISEQKAIGAEPRRPPDVRVAPELHERRDARR